MHRVRCAKTKVFNSGHESCRTSPDLVYQVARLGICKLRDVILYTGLLLVKYVNVCSILHLSWSCYTSEYLVAEALLGRVLPVEDSRLQSTADCGWANCTCIARRLFSCQRLGRMSVFSTKVQHDKHHMHPIKDMGAMVVNVSAKAGQCKAVCTDGLVLSSASPGAEIRS